MKKTNILLRVLCGLFDAIIIMIPVQFVMLGVFNVSIGQADLLYKLLFAVYGTLFTEYMGGTIAKKVGKITIVDVSGVKAPILYVGLRELMKSMYVIPVIGWALCLISIFMMIFRKDGRALHDYVGNTRVIYQWNKQEV